MAFFNNFLLFSCMPFFQTKTHLRNLIPLMWDRGWTSCLENIWTNQSSLTCVVSKLLLLTHQQTSIERGFSVNKQVEVDSLCQDMFITWKIVHNHIFSVGEIMCVDITKGLITSCQGSRSRYSLTEVYHHGTRQKSSHAD